MRSKTAFSRLQGPPYGECESVEEVKEKAGRVAVIGRETRAENLTRSRGNL